MGTGNGASGTGADEPFIPAGGLNAVIEDGLAAVFAVCCDRVEHLQHRFPSLPVEHIHLWPPNGLALHRCLVLMVRGIAAEKVCLLVDAEEVFEGALLHLI